MIFQALSNSVPDYGNFCLVEQKKQQQKYLSKTIEEGNNELSTLKKEYEEQVAEVRRLSEELQEKEKECDTLNQLQNMKRKEVTKLKARLDEMIKKREEEIKQLKEELVMKRKILSEYSERIQDLQQQLDKKTAEYEQVSSKVTQLERERSDQENKFRIMQKECEQKLQCEAARTLGAIEHAEEIEVSYWELVSTAIWHKEHLTSIEFPV